MMPVPKQRVRREVMALAKYVDAIWEGVAGGATRAQRQPCRYQAYIPDRLVSRQITLPAEIAADLADAERAIAGLQGQGPSVTNLEGFARLLLRAESVASSFIEGLQIGVRRLAKEQAALDSGFGSQDETERAVLGNITAMNQALALADRAGPVTVEDICEIHAQLLGATSYADYGGVIRNQQNWIGGINPCRAEFVPPPPEYVRPLLEDLCSYISGDDHSPLLQAALVHAQFETIHPFADGNGRTGRALIHLVLRRRGVAPRYVPPISLILATHASSYISALSAYRHGGSADSEEAKIGVLRWLDVFVSDAIRACHDADDLMLKMEELQLNWRQQMGRVRVNSSIDLLLKQLPGIPVLTVATAMKLIERSKTKTNEAVNQLLDHGVLKQTTVGRRNRAFEAPDLLVAITNFERVLGSPTGDLQADPPTRIAPAPM
jgi:Fic family protein